MAKKNMQKKNGSVPGKKINSNEIVSAVDSCLDGWFTAGNIIKSLKNLCQIFRYQYFLVIPDLLQIY